MSFIHDSSTFQAIVREGEVAEARKILRMLGDDAFGAPNAATAVRIEGLTDLAQLEAALTRLRTVTNWMEVLGPTVEGYYEGAVAEARKILRLQGDDAFGAPDAATAALIDSLTDLTQLEAALKRLRTAASWSEVLGSAALRPRGKRRRPS